MMKTRRGLVCPFVDTFFYRDRVKICASLISAHFFTSMGDVYPL
ncbi:hypothetical protein EMIT040CA3_10387 [Bacillus pseudomycoides]